MAGARDYRKFGDIPDAISSVSVVEEMPDG